MENNKTQDMKNKKPKKKWKKWLFILVLLCVAGYVVWYSASPESPKNKQTEESKEVEAFLEENIGPKIREKVIAENMKIFEGYEDAEQLAKEKADKSLNYSDAYCVTKNGISEFKKTEYSESKKYMLDGLYEYGSTTIFIHNTKSAAKGTISAFEAPMTIEYTKVKISDDVEYQYLNGELLLTIGNTVYLWTTNGDEKNAQEAYDQYVQMEKIMEWPDLKEFKESLLQIDVES